VTEVLQGVTEGICYTSEELSVGYITLELTILTHIWSWTVLEVMMRQILNKMDNVRIM